MPVDLDTNEYVDYNSPPPSAERSSGLEDSTAGDGTTNHTNDNLGSLPRKSSTPSTDGSTTESPLNTGSNTTESPGRSATTTDSSNSSSSSSNESSFSLPDSTNPVLFNGFLSLTKKPKNSGRPPRNLASNGIYNPYNSVGERYNQQESSVSDDDSSAASVVSGPGPAAVYIPSTMQSKAISRQKKRKEKLMSSGFPIPASMGESGSAQADSSVIGIDEDDASQRTPIPLAPPSMPHNGLPSSFLRDRTHTASNSTIVSNESTISSEDGGENLSVTKQKKREQENVGRLVVAAKHQQSFAQAWFAASTNSSNVNALPPPVKKASDKPQKQGKRVRLSEQALAKAGSGGEAGGPIDIDSGEVWVGPDDEEGSNNGDEKSKRVEVGSFAFTTHSMKTKKRNNLMKNFLSLGVPEDEDLTLYTEKNFWSRIVCTVGNTRCTSLALLILALGVAVAAGGAVVTILYFIPSNKAEEPAETTFPSAPPTLSMAPSISSIPSLEPSAKPSLGPSAAPTLIPTSKPSISPTSEPTSNPSSHPTMLPSIVPSSKPTSQPSSQPTSKPSIEPSLSHVPSSQPSSMPSKFFSSVTFNQVGGDIGAPDIDGAGAGLTESDQTGFSVAVSNNGEVIASASRFYPSVRKGSVTVYQRGYTPPDKFDWVQMGEPIVGLNDNEEFGFSLALSDDGKTIVVGSPKYDSPTSFLPNSGAVRVFVYIDATNEWSQLGQEIVGDDLDPDEFGTDVSISASGMTITVGAPFYSLRFTGQVSVYDYAPIEGQWNRVFFQFGFIDFEQFGAAVTLSGDGNVLAAGSAFEGYVNIYEFDPSFGWSWIGEVEERFQNTDFGYSMSLSYDGRVLAVGSPISTADYVNDSGNEESVPETGHVSVFQYGNPTLGEEEMIDFSWHLIGSKIIGEPSANQKSGWSVSLSNNGTDVAIGAPYWTSADDSSVNDIGQVVVYRWNGASWVASKALTGQGSNENFGYDVSLSGSGATLLVGAPSLFFGGLGSGITRVYELEP